MQLEPDGQYIKKGQIDELVHEMSKTTIGNWTKNICNTSCRSIKCTVHANTLLKFLEEPQSEITAILLTDRIHALTSNNTIQMSAFKFSFNATMLLLKQKLVEEGITDSMASTVCKMTNQVEEAITFSER